MQGLLIARPNGLLKLGNVALDGTKLKANASRHSARSHGHALKFRQFPLRGVNPVSGEWDRVCLADNVKRMHRMQGI